MGLDLGKGAVVAKGSSFSLDLSKGGAIGSGRKLAFVGLGWDSPADLDASLIMLGANGKPRTADDLYYFNHLFDGHTKEDGVHKIAGRNAIVDEDNGVCDYTDVDNAVRKKSPIIHLGDARESADDDNGDEEVILIDFDKIPADVAKLAVVVSIFFDPTNPEDEKVVFGQVTNAYVRVCFSADEDSWLNGIEKSVELTYDLTEDASTSNAMLFCEIVRNGSSWDFNAIGESIGDGSADNGIVPIAQKYGLA